jgi:predicted MPP superfamily phosphohydrolase
MNVFTIFLLLFGVSQLYWVWRGLRRLRASTRRRGVAVAAGAAVAAIYLLLLAYNFDFWGRRPTPLRLTSGEALLHAPFMWWAVSSLGAFLLVVIFWAVAWPARAAVRAVRKGARPNEIVDRPSSRSRRDFLQQSADIVAAVPFVAGAYGILHGRLDLEVTRQPIRLPKLPAAFEGFRIAQLSDIHIGPFMPERQIREFADLTNSLKPDLIALTGDFVTWDASTQAAAVRSLANLRAPFGVFVCLGNHETWSGVEDSITELFRDAKFKVLRQQNVAIASGPDSFNLIGIDFASKRAFGHGGEVFARRFAAGMNRLIKPDCVNILLSHNPDTFDHAAELGIDLSLAGHTHGGQASLEFISPQLAPSRLVTPYVAGHFVKPGGQLYVNRGIGTIGVPLRVGAPPEITIHQLTRG